MTKIRFLGAAREVTGSMHLIETNGCRFLLDCGMKQGKRKESYERNKNFPFKPSDIDSVIVSHAHVDHVGNLPTLMVQGFNGRVFCTPATKDLCSLILPDSAHVQEKDVEYVNKNREKQGKALFEPLYTEADAMESLKLFEEKNLGETFKICDNVEAYFLNAGHILGSAMAIIKIKDGERDLRIGFTGDLGRDELPILKNPDILSGIDYLITESTYGARDHEKVENALEKFAELIHDAIKKRSKIIIPGFAVQRTQEILYVINKLYTSNRIPPIKVFVDSPLAINVTEVFKKHSECFDEEMLEFMANNNNPFYLNLVKYTKDVEASKAINDYSEPCIVLAASGMCEAGRILHHLKNNIENPKNTILFVGFQAKDTLGRMILDGAKTVKIFGESYSVNADIVKINEFSAHAGHADLLSFIKKTAEGGKLKKVFLVHGEPDNQEMLMADMAAAGIKNFINPEMFYEEELK